MAKSSKKKEKKASIVEEKPAVSQKLASDAPASVPKRKTKAERKQSQIDGIKKTIVPGIIGIIAGYLCYILFGNGTNILVSGVKLEWHFVLMNLFLVTILVQRAIYPYLGIDVMSFKGRDWLYVEFIVIDLWAVTWTILLN